MTMVARIEQARVQGGSAACAAPVRIALLGLGRVGSAVAALAADVPLSDCRFEIMGALVRDVDGVRRRRATCALETDSRALLRRGADVVVEAMGGIEPARSILREAIDRGIPVVTANKSVLAAHGDELLTEAARAGVPLRYEAAVIAGVPFLGTFAERHFASRVSKVTGIVNGTSNYVLSRMANEHLPFDEALHDAQSRGYAEPDPSNDIRGIDATEKLCVLLRHFGAGSVFPAQLETVGIERITPADLSCAATFGGRIRPVVQADWSAGALRAFCGPAFVVDRDPLAGVDGVLNAIRISTVWTGDLFFSGPGAGPTVTAASLLDDALQATALRADNFSAATKLANTRGDGVGRAAAVVGELLTGWFVRIEAPCLAPAAAVADLLGAYGVWTQRTSALDTRGGSQRQWLLVHPCPRPRLAAALAALEAASGCVSHSVRVLEA